MIGAKDDGSLGLAGHPQAALSRLLATMGATRADVRPLGEVAPALRARGAFLSEALRPAESTHFWRRRRGALSDDNIGAALDDVALIEADSEAEEALALAIALRAALETPGKTAALITPDRAIARRVQAELMRWGAEVADSAGATLGATPAGALARLILASAESGGALDLAALLAHPLTRLARPRGALALQARTLDLGVLRGVLPAGALDDISALIEHSRAAAREPHAHEALKALGDDAWRGAQALLRDALDALAPLRALAPGAPLSHWVAALDEAVELFARGTTGDPEKSNPPHPEAPFAQQRASKDGRQEPPPPPSSFETAAAQPPQDEGEEASIEALRDLLDDWTEAAEGAFTLGLGDFRRLFDAVAAQRRAPDAAREHPRLHILGLLEARLLSFDLALLAGLDETIWPPQARTDAFLNRPMRAELGLSAPERRIGQTAHDFAAALGARQAILSRSKKRGDAPTVASRFVQRLRAVAGEAAFAGVVARGEAWLALARGLDQPAAMRPIKRPEPRPPVALRPQSLSVTRIEALRRDPYAIYAERILELKPLEPIGAAAGYREIGTIWHEALRRFVEAFPAGALPSDAPSRLRAIARDCFTPMLADPGFAALAWPRIEGGLAAFLAFESEDRDAIQRILVEVSGALVIPLADGSSFKLTAKADRIDLFRDRAARLVDYKTGAMPGVDEIKVGLAPQLTLEAAMLKRGGFREAPDVREARALYLKLGGARGGERRDLTTFKEVDFDEMVERHFAGMIELLDQFRDAQTPYLSRPAPKFAKSFGDYDHLARVKEWSATGGLVEDGGEA